ncbi:MAG: YlbF family regulator [Clostridia bacterium]|nr:YlbF family regulator [Clostridia bacterium]
MNFYDNINNLVAAFKKTPEYAEYLSLKEKLRTNEENYKMLKDFKDKQNEVQISYLNGQEMSKEKQAEMENLYSIVIQNEDCRKILECEMRINVILADLQKAMGEAIEELIKF